MTDTHIDDVDWRPLATALADDIAAKQQLSPEWKRALVEVPRHVFVPGFYGDDGSYVDVAAGEAWLNTVYSDESLITQQKTVEGWDLPWPTSSSTLPSLMMLMLDLLDVSDSDTVLEIGTGTGLNAGFLSHRLGSNRVCSIDIDPALVELARVRLAQLGYDPRLEAGDGARGIPSTAPYSRIIGTCAVDGIPAAWVRQLAPLGVIVADVRGELESSLIKVQKLGDRVTGRFLNSPGHFMWLRPDPTNPLRGSNLDTIDMRDPSTATGDIPPAAFHDEAGFRFLLQFAIDGLNTIGTELASQEPGASIRASDGSWIDIGEHTAGGYPVTFGGPRQLWPLMERAWREWHSHKTPGIDKFGLTASANGDQRLWVDDPEWIIHKRHA